MSDNLLIATFMGGTPCDRCDDCGMLKFGESDYRSLEFLRYHKDWNLLIDVVSKIENIKDSHNGHFGVHIISNSCTIQATKFNPSTEDMSNPHYFDNITHDGKIEAVYTMVVNFINWHNNL